MAKTAIKARSRVGGGTSARLRPADKAAGARGRLARRARRQKWFKENKRRLGLIAIIFVLVMFLAFFTPFGPDWYYGKLQQHKMATPTTVGSGYFEGLYKLGNFYRYTFRREKARECYDEIATMFYGFTFTEYGVSPTNAQEKRFEYERNIAKGLRVGPPFSATDRDLPFIAHAMRGVAEFYDADGRRGFGKNILDLYLNEFIEEHPTALPADYTEEMRHYARFLDGR